MRKIFSLCCSVLLLSSCGEYYKVQKSTDVNERYSYAKKCYNEKKYSRTISLLEDILPSFAPTSEGPQSTYLMANSHYELGHEEEAARFFQRYYNSYPKSPRAAEALYKAGYCLYMASPEAKLDQTASYEAIKVLQNYLDLYPKGEYADEVLGMLFRLQDKLAYKEFLSAELYYNLGLYIANNYLSSVITAQNALKDYPHSKYKEDFIFLILKAKAKEAELSVIEKQQERVRSAIDQYYVYLNSFPRGRYMKEAQQLFERLDKLMIK